MGVVDYRQYDDYLALGSNVLPKRRNQPAVTCDVYDVPMQLDLRLLQLD